MKSIQEWEAEQAEWDAYRDAMLKPCIRCGKDFEGASYMGRCFNCHDLMARPYESGEDFIGIRG
jgi:hypothetical protein